MSYITRDEFIARRKEEELIDLTDRDGTGAIDERVIDQAINEAGEIIDGMLASRYKLPLTEIPSMLKWIAADIALYRLYDEFPTDEVEKKMQRAERYLRDIAAGKVSIGITPSGAVPSGANGATMSSDGRIFKRGGGFL